MDHVFPKIRKKPNIFKERRAMAQHVKCSSRCKETLASADMFGEEVKLTYKGKETFNTTIGSLLSLAIIFMLMSFGGYKLFILISRDNPDVSQQTFLRDLDSEPPLIPYNDSVKVGGFDIAFGVGRPIDSSIGYYRVNEVHFYYSMNETNPATGKPKRIKARRPL